MTPEQELELITQDLNYNKSYEYHYKPIIQERTFKSIGLKNLASDCINRELEFTPDIVSGLIDSEFRERFKAVAQARLKTMSTRELAEASAELNIVLLEGLLKIKLDRLASTTTTTEPITEPITEPLPTTTITEPLSSEPSIYAEELPVKKSKSKK